MAVKEKASPITASDLFARLEAKHPTDKGWIVLKEVRNAMGFGGMRSADAVAVNTWPSSSKIVAFEIKVSVQDFRRELDKPGKRGVFTDQVHEFWFVAPRGVIPVDELPEGCGLLETHGRGLRSTRRATQAMDREPSLDFWMSLVRSCHQAIDRKESALRADDFAEFRGRSVGIEDLRRLAEKLGTHMLQFEIERYRERDRKRMEERRERVDWWSNWRSVVQQAQRLASAVNGKRRWSMEPSEVSEVLEGITHSHEAKDLAAKLRHAADMIDPAEKAGEGE